MKNNFGTIIKKIFDSDSAGGVLLLVATVLALVLENSIAAGKYHSFLEFHIGISVGDIELDYSLHHWINEGLMVIFFLLVGLEIKREFLAGQLANINYVILPTFAALGGILVPAFLFYLFNSDNPATLSGWAVPTATDIAFAVGIIALFGRLLPHNVKLFVLALAVIDDIGAIIIIAVVYSGDINLMMLLFSFFCVFCMVLFNLLNVRSLTPYLLVGLLSWFFMLNTGIHPTLTGILIAFCIPLKTKPKAGLPHAFGQDLGTFRMGYVSPAYKLEHTLHRTVMLGILPLFAFVNSGLPLANAFSEGLFFSGISLGVFFGLFIGKPIGMLAGTFLWRFLFRIKFPPQIDPLNLLAMGFICGIGFTMSLLIGTIAYAGNESFIDQTLIGILAGSLFSGIAGSMLFVYWIKKNPPRPADLADQGESLEEIDVPQPGTGV